MWRFELDPETREHLKNQWNERVSSIRKTELVMAIIMIALGILCFLYPSKSIYVIEIIVSIAILAFGIFKIAEYFSVPVYIRMPGMIVSGILDILIGIMLMTSPEDELLMTFSFLIAIDLMVMGIEEISYSSLLKWITAEGYQWVIVNGVMNIILSIFFFAAPITSSVAIMIILAVYLIICGIGLLIEFFKSKDMKIKNEDVIDG